MMRRWAAALALVAALVAPSSAATFPRITPQVSDDVVLGGSLVITSQNAAPSWRTVATFTCLQANSRISDVALTAFYDCANSAVATWADGKSRITVTDSTGTHALMGYLSTAGTGETLDTEQFVNGNFASNEPPGSAWTRQAGWTIAGGYGVALTAASTYMYQTAATRSGGLIKLVFDLVTVTSNGVRPALTNLGGTLPLYSSPQSGITTYATMAGGVYSIGFFANTSFSGTVGNAHAAYVLTPSVTGATVTSAASGVSGNAWTSETGGFNRNDTTYSVVIERYY